MKLKRDDLVEESIAHAAMAEQRLEQISRLEERNDMSTMQIPRLMESAKVHARLAEVYSRLAVIEGRR